MHWLAMELKTTHQASEAVVDRLSALGADGVAVHDPLEWRALLAGSDGVREGDIALSEADDDPVQVTAYFAWENGRVRRNRRPDFLEPALYDDRPKTWVRQERLIADVRAQLRRIGEHLPIGAGITGYAVIDEEEWAENWKKHFRTQRLTRRLTINPSWIHYQPSPGEHVVTLDPGGAFGSGEHQTTRMCAELLDLILRPNDRVLDLGCGSGILAIAAALLGAASVDALDIDERAVDIARANAAANGVAAHIRTGVLDDAELSHYDLILANITANVLIPLMPALHDRLAAGGRLVLSGIIAGRLEACLTAARDAGLRVTRRLRRGEWRALVLERCVDVPAPGKPIATSTLAATQPSIRPGGGSSACPTKATSASAATQLSIKPGRRTSANGMPKGK